jgi:hypothetical protein
MQPAFVFDESYRDQNEHHDENDALFVFGEFKNSEQVLHRSVAQVSLFNFGTRFSSLDFLQIVILSEAKNLSHFFLHPTARDVSLRST